MALIPDDKPRFAHAHQDEWLQSPRIVLPKLQEIVSFNSVLDVGCGLGYWLLAAQELGVTGDTVGVDGDWLEQSLLLIDRSRFVAHDLEMPFDLGRRFDLVISLEVAEHLSPEASDGFIESLTRHGDVILFGAAIPGQRGENHVCERWPGYWVEKLERHGYRVLDVLRPLFWDDPGVVWWYKQNMLLAVADVARVRVPPTEVFLRPRALVHPELFERDTPLPEGGRLRGFARRARAVVAKSANG